MSESTFNFRITDNWLSLLLELAVVMAQKGEDLAAIDELVFSSYYSGSFSRSIGKANARDQALVEFFENVLISDNLPPSARLCFERLLSQANDRIENDLNGDEALFGKSIRQ